LLAGLAIERFCRKSLLMRKPPALPASGGRIEPGSNDRKRDA
jgi:hypothetical protein